MDEYINGVYLEYLMQSLFPWIYGKDFWAEGPVNANANGMYTLDTF